MSAPAAPLTARSAPVRTDVLAVALSTAVAMWLVGFAARTPAIELPAPALLAALGALLVAGGVAAGMLSPRGWRCGLEAGALAQLVNLLVLGGVLHQPAVAPAPHTDDGAPALSASAGDGAGNRSPIDAVVWVPGSIAIGAAAGAVGGAIGAALAVVPPPRMRTDWSAPLVLAAGAATLGVICLGGLVTGFEVGMAVPDWPTTFGWTMFLYPLSRMTGGVYYEHSHRLMGSLVGLCTLIVAAHLWRRDRRRGVRWAGLAVLATVCVQGLLGGFRVTASDVRLAAVHGVLGQLVLVALAALAAACTTTWKRPNLDRVATPADRTGAVALIAALCIQLALGSANRHHLHAAALYAHLVWALPTAILAIVVGARVHALPHTPPHARRGAALMLGLVLVQLALGFAAYIATKLPRANGLPIPGEVAITTAHQSCGAVLFATAGWVSAWVIRLAQGGGPSQPLRSPPELSDSP